MENYEYERKFVTLIAREKNAEKEFQEEEIKRLPPAVRENKGRTLTSMVRQKQNQERDSIFRFVKSNNSALPKNELRPGSNVLLSIKDPLNGITGSIIKVSQFAVDIYIPKQSNLLYKELRIDLYANDTTYEAQKEAIQSVKNWPMDGLADVILEKKRPRLGKRVSSDFYDKTLNPSQKLAVQYSLQEKDMYLIQGPPGTGKTKTSVEIVRQHLGKNKILVCADSNIAVDNIMLGLLKYADVIRIGESPKILPQIQEHTLNNIIKTDARYKQVEQTQKRMNELKEKQRKELVPNKRNSKGISHLQIRKFAEQGVSEFGINSDDMASMGRWINLQEEIKLLQKRINAEKEKITKEKIEQATIICTTNTQASNLDFSFDFVLIDEAGQSTEPSCLIPISKANKAVLVGDHKQLPPTIISQDAKDLSVSLFERMIGKCRYVLLDTQYRMHPLINEFPSNTFYEGKLKSFDTSKRLNSPFSKNVIFMECDGLEKRHQTSYFNEEEAEKVKELVDKYISLGVKDIGVISPYSEQVKKLQNLNVEVNTIDGFQGREKDLIIISLVRTNGMGFLKDLRRLNVALTRAMRELVVIGHKSIAQDPTYKEFMDFAEKKGVYEKLR